MAARDPATSPLARGGRASRLERRGLPRERIPAWHLMRTRELYEGRHLPRQLVPGAVPGALLPRASVLPKRRYDLRLPPSRAPWSGTSSGAMANVFGNDELACTT